MDDSALRCFPDTVTRRWTKAILVALGTLVLLAPLAPAPAPAAPARDVIDWASLPYLYYNENGQFFNVPTNGATFTARRITNVNTGFSTDYRTPEQYDGKVLEAIWDKTCPAEDDQKIHQSRTVYLPGAPGTLLVNLQMTVFDPASHKFKNPIAWAEVRINGTVVARVEHGSRRVNTWLKVDASDRAQSVNFGENTITIVAKKAQTKKAWGFCSPKTDPGFGVSAEVVGLPATDARSDITSTVPGDAVFDLTATVTNDGPSGMGGGPSGGQFDFSTYAETGTDVTELTLTSPGSTCSTHSNGDGLTAVCQLPVIEAGQSVSIQVHIGLQNGCPYSVPLAYTVVSGWRDPNYANNGISLGHIDCSAQ